MTIELKFRKTGQVVIHRNVAKVVTDESILKLIFLNGNELQLTRNMFAIKESGKK